MIAQPRTANIDPHPIDLAELATWKIHGPGCAESEVAPVQKVEDPFVEAFRTIPGVGETVFGFLLLRELGQGTFGRVFLATQPELADRRVVLKISADLTGESRTLAQLQHTNIVPVYSVHRGNRHQAVCMPYFGSTTLARLIHHYRDTNTLPASGRDFVESFRSLTAPAASQVRAEAGTPNSAETEQLKAILAAGSYTRAVAWLGARLADGLAHAHDRGMIHRDIKPANILLTDDGQPMLLDFGLAEELSRRAALGAGVVGGTPAYMAPEQLEEVRDRVPRALPASDLFSLGVVLYELLTGRFPFSETADPEAMIRERSRIELPPVREFNSEVSPGLESILHLCLAPDHRNRYPSAALLREDLDCFLADRPLRTAPERSWRERATKWTRRHPRISSMTTILAVVTVLTVGGVASLQEKRTRLRQLEAEQTFRSFTEESKAAQLILYAKPDDNEALAKGYEQGLAAVTRYRASEPGWEQAQVFASLSPENQAQLRRELAETYLLLARAVWFRSTQTARPDPDGVTTALRYNEIAEQLVPDDPPRLVYVQRQTMFTALGRAKEAAEAGAILSRTLPRTARDFYSEAGLALNAGRTAEAARWYRKAQEADPKAFWPYYGEGVCRASAGEWAAARGCYTAALVLNPDSDDARANRAVANLRLGDAAAAIEDATIVLRKTPEHADALLTRAEAFGELKKFDEGLDDAEAALSAGATSAALSLREKLRRQAGQIDPKIEPATAEDWIKLGLDRLPTDQEAALELFNKAIEVDPTSVRAVMCRAHVFGETQREAEAEICLTRAIELNPKQALAWSGRAVMRARLKRDAEAIADARKALELSFQPVLVYQIASVYARLSARQPEYADEALTLLRIALRAGADSAQLATDSEFEPLRDSLAFRKILEDAARSRPTPLPKK